MARVTVVGTGYVGTVTAVCLALLDHDVVGLDVDHTRAEQLAAGQVPFHEPAMLERLQQALESGRLSFASDPATAVGNARTVASRTRFASVPLAPTVAAARCYERLGRHPRIRAAQLPCLAEDTAFAIDDAARNLVKHANALQSKRAAKSRIAA